MSVVLGTEVRMVVTKFPKFIVYDKVVIKCIKVFNQFSSMLNFFNICVVAYCTFHVHFNPVYIIGLE